MTDIDAMLARLRESPVHPGLAVIDTAVFDELAARAGVPATPGARGLSMAAVVALFIGIAGSALPGTQVRAASISPLGAPPTLAPSTLLGAE
ncbi:hypothetical protein [Sphingomonas cavernae]|uniref:Uncharacterized protein n=1 Tax=Sphingomonas cavernae TaxID=2320861 RepID=A0A418WRC2_9SPHN|nr:hypothetical protein [Sphingomonas cavernae]RJF93795.1 hypothetical protein D3876_05775 [Sphingomonas cavernae]